ncbi:hypothetical protein [Glutamicibacter sp. JC586]|uniref:hypothetical protein n=1 Tax=Glutamicibacter sp. JC586 TaxID=2590552 RepID=UPI0013589680|nr:hypothetical protein [Glutamicibacter sp. JC586]
MEIIDALLHGQRGRRLLWEFAVASEAKLVANDSQRHLYIGMSHASYQIENARGDSVVMFGPGAEDREQISVGVEELADLLGCTALIPTTEPLLRSLLSISTDAARYWQAPDGIDSLLASKALKSQLARVAEHIVRSGLAEQWFEPVDRDTQHRVYFETPEPYESPQPLWRTGIESLLAWKEHVIVTEARSVRTSKKYSLGTFSGEWWSAPSMYVDSTCGEFSDGQPVGLSCVEDGFGWEKATATKVDIPRSDKVLEISSAEQWVKLCQDHGIEVTWQKRHDWYHVTGRDGAWVIPDWLAVARNYDGVHLSIGAYLALAGECLSVDTKFATIMAGWDPDKTYWFIDDLRDSEHSQNWKCVDVHSNDAHWIMDEDSKS